MVLHKPLSYNKGAVPLGTPARGVKSPFPLEGGPSKGEGYFVEVGMGVERVMGNHGMPGVHTLNPEGRFFVSISPWPQNPNEIRSALPEDCHG